MKLTGKQNKFQKRVTGIVACVMIISVALIGFYDYLYPIEYGDIIEGKAEKHHLDPWLVTALIRQESRFQADAVSHKGAVGLMQIMPATGSWIAEKNNVLNFQEQALLDAENNVEMGCWYLKYLLDEFSGDISLALAAYNGGIGNVKKWLQDERYSHNGTRLDYIPFNETRNYVRNVLGSYEIYKKTYKNQY